MIPDCLQQALIGESISKLIEHRWLPAEMLIKRIIMIDVTSTTERHFCVTVSHHKPGIAYALRTLRG